MIFEISAIVSVGEPPLTTEKFVVIGMLMKQAINIDRIA